MREERVLLEDHVHRPLVRRYARHILSLEHDPALVGHLEAGDHAQRRGLAAPARSQHREELAFADRERHVVHGRGLAVALAHTFERDPHAWRDGHRSASVNSAGTIVRRGRRNAQIHPARRDRRRAALAASVHAGRAWPTPPAKTLRFYDWIGYVHPRTYTAFTKATGVAVERAYYTSNEALEARLKAAPHAYDLAVPTGYMVEKLAAAKMLTRIDWTKLPTVKKTIDPQFRRLPWDPHDEWSVPKDWGTTGFVYRTDLIKERPRTWAQFFALFKTHPRKLTLLSPRPR